MHKKVSKSFALPVLLLASCAGYAAQPIDLESKPVSILKPYIAQSATPTLKRGMAPAVNNANTNGDLTEIRRSVDAKGTTHIRMQQTHGGYPVWGADSVVHVRKVNLAKRTLANVAGAADTASSTMNGVVYQGLDQDLQSAPASVFTQGQADAAQSEALTLANQQYAKGTPSDVTNNLMVYVDENNQAHWAFLSTLYFPISSANRIPSRPHFILDAQTFQVYKQWNDVEAVNGDYNSLKAAKLDKIDGGGYGGNPTAGRLVYDGASGDFDKFSILRDAAKKTCYLKNTSLEVHDESNDGEIANFPCGTVDTNHNNVYWDGKLHEANEGYSPDNDAFYAGAVVKELYKDWYGINVLVDKNGNAMMLKLNTHTGDNYENAVWDSQKQEIFLGDGADTFYPLTSLGVIAHEVSHGFTQQHSSLIYHDQSGALNESFSDMAAQAAELKALGQSSWQIGSEISKTKGQALRYMDKPSKDCAAGSKPGDDCSIDSFGEFPDLVTSSKKIKGGDSRDSYIVHLASGVYNRVFYLIGTADGWDARKAFEVMVQANANYWTSTSTFEKAACGVLSATKDLGYQDDAVKDAFKTVRINTSKC